MSVLLYLLLAAGAHSLPQELSSLDGAAENKAPSETTTFPSINNETVDNDEAVAIDNDETVAIDIELLQAMEQELIKSNIKLTRDESVPKAIAQLVEQYDRLEASTPRPQDNSPSLRLGGGGAGGGEQSGEGQGSSTAALIAAYGVGSIVSLAKVALAMIAANSGTRRASVSMTGAATGTLQLTQQSAPFGPTSINGTLEGLTEGMHGISIYEFGNMTGSCDNIGGHYNPFQMGHGPPNSFTRHVGDLGNIKALANGTAFVNVTNGQVLLVGPTSVIGRAVVVHELEDDLGLGGDEASTTDGNAGMAVGCGVIGRA